MKQSFNQNNTMRIILVSFLYCRFLLISQEIEPIKDSAETKVDSLYREDQFYFLGLRTIHYNRNRRYRKVSSQQVCRPVFLEICQ
jgi:hypothetical protein